MGILNVTPDSFYDGGSCRSPEAAVAKGREMAAQGAAIIDIGGESTRPGAQPVAAEEECSRILPVLAGLSGCGALLSVDTRNPEVMVRAAAAGADMINDVSGMRDPSAAAAAAESGCAVCVMHMKGDPESMQSVAQYGDVVAEVKAFLEGRLEALGRSGVDPQRVCVDPGFGFGKRLEHNLDLLARLGELRGLGCPLLVGMSRKSMLGMITGRDVEGRLAAGVGAALLALDRGARIIRTHDVAETVDAARVWSCVHSAGQPAPEGAA
jgi:dihydropteroate synthase